MVRGEGGPSLVLVLFCPNRPVSAVVEVELPPSIGFLSIVVVSFPGKGFFCAAVSSLSLG